MDYLTNNPSVVWKQPLLAVPERGGDKIVEGCANWKNHWKSTFKNSTSQVKLQKGYTPVIFVGGGGGSPWICLLSLSTVFGEHRANDTDSPIQGDLSSSTPFFNTPPLLNSTIEKRLLLFCKPKFRDTLLCDIASAMLEYLMLVKLGETGTLLLHSLHFGCLFLAFSL